MELEIILNQDNVSNLEEFIHTENRYCNGVKKTTFVFQLGCDSEEAFLKDIQKADEILSEVDKFSKCFYERSGILENYMSGSDREKYSDRIRKWEGGKERNISDFTFENAIWQEQYLKALRETILLYQSVESNEQRQINFLLVLAYRIDFYFPKLFKKTKVLSKFPKFIYINHCSIQDFFFLYLLCQCGCDVYGIHTQVDFTLPQKLHSYVFLVKKSNPITCKIPEYSLEYTLQRIGNNEKPKTNHGMRECVNATKKENTVLDTGDATRENVELSYEELAARAGSVVMIIVYDQDKKPFASGSGVIINSSGYILTNFHVIQGGAYFGIRLEEEEDLYITTEIIKCHRDNDLAILRMEEISRPSIPLCRGRKLVRGQKVVAIGSPLGLFNTVSDGIIAGFRNFDHVSMIQFTAPTSHGSSGGALLNMYGELIGLVSAGFDDGENLNLAVDYETIESFVKGFSE